MEFKDMIGPSYRSLSKYASVERCVNFFLEVIEDPHEQKTRQVLYPTPCTGPFGISLIGYDIGQKSRGLIEVNGRIFGVNGNTFYEYTVASHFDQLNPPTPANTNY